jgi:alpha-tubulin suppressor-like RCC1 family protein
LSKEVFKFIASGEDFNLVLSQSGKLYSFGLSQNPFSSKKASTYFELQPFDERVATISCGPQHLIAIDSNGSAYSWGNCQNGRCGLIREQDLSITASALSVKRSRFMNASQITDNTNSSNSIFVPKPTLIN